MEYAGVLGNGAGPGDYYYDTFDSETWTKKEELSLMALGANTFSHMLLSL